MHAFNLKKLEVGSQTSEVATQKSELRSRNSEVALLGHRTVTNNVYIRPRQLHFPMLQIYCLPNKFFCADC